MQLAQAYLNQSALSVYHAAQEVTTKGVYRLPHAIYCCSQPLPCQTLETRLSKRPAHEKLAEGFALQCFVRVFLFFDSLQLTMCHNSYLGVTPVKQVLPPSDLALLAHWVTIQPKLRGRHFQQPQILLQLQWSLFRCGCRQLYILLPSCIAHRCTKHPVLINARSAGSDRYSPLSCCQILLLL